MDSSFSPQGFAHQRLDAYGIAQELAEGVVRYLHERGKLARLPGDLIVAGSAVEGIRTSLVESDWERFTIAEFKERFGLTRKWAIPVLEHLDSIGATRRVGPQRIIVRTTK